MPGPVPPIAPVRAVYDKTTMPTGSTTPALVRLIGVSKRFSAIRALDAIDLALEGGRIHALCGENGAGKSTLIQALGGVFRPDSGRIEIDGKDVRFRDPASALAEGIGIIYQELHLVEPFTVAENIYLGHEPPRGPWIDRPEMDRRARALLDDLRFDLDPRSPVADLTIGQRQQVEIAKALGRKVRILVLDEPTAALSKAETDQLFRILRELRSRGLALLYVSHHLEEVFEIADQITVLRDGRKIGTWPTSTLRLAEVVAHMVGEAVDLRRSPPRKADAAPLLAAVGLAGRSFRDVDLEIRPGEIVGLTGLAGSGHEELPEVLYGAAPRASGQITWKGRPFRPRHPEEATAQGLAYLPPDRRGQGLIPTQGIIANVSLSSLRFLSDVGWIRQNARRKLTEEWCQRFEVAASRLSQPAITLSGGNQQKVLLARGAALEPELFLLAEPTRGIDVKTREAIHRWIEELALSGRGVLLVSSDTQELIRLADRCLVFRSGRIVREFAPAELDEPTLIAAMMEG
jgi:ABC-type sugar transport system ATPase subunit